MSEQVIWLYSVMRDEASILPFWLRHYRSWVDRIVVYDAGSEDNTPALLRAAGAEVRAYPGPAGMDDVAMVELANATYREARGRAGWVLWVDADELLWRERPRQCLAACTAAGVTLPRTAGYQMLAETFPPDDGHTPITSLIKEGIRDESYDKSVMVDPRLDVRWLPGKHQCDAPGAVRSEAALFALLHYRCLGEAYLRERHARNYARWTARERALGLGHATAPDWNGHASARWFIEEALPARKRVLP